MKRISLKRGAHRALTLAFGLFVVPALVFARAQDPVRVGGNVPVPERVRYVVPVYPADAMSSNVQGIVIAEIVVGVDGTVGDVKVLRSIPLLDEAAIAAVKQWRYMPTFLNGNPVPVIMTVTVNFTMAPSTPMPAGTAAAPVQMTSPAPPPMWNGKRAVRIGGDIKAPERIRYVPPVYPDDALQVKAQGIVIIEGIIDEEGNVAQAKVLKSVAMLDQAALDSVLAWKYMPTLVNGVAVPVVMTVTVNFNLR